MSIHPTAMIHATATIASTATIAARVKVHAGASIAGNCVVDEDSELFENCVIGTPAFAFRTNDRGQLTRITRAADTNFGPFGGELTQMIRDRAGESVKIGKFVEIGAGCIVESGLVGPTTIGDGVKMGGRCQIGHESFLGNKVLLCPAVTIGGHTHLASHVFCGPASCLTDHITVGDSSQIGAHVLVTTDIPPGSKVH